MHIQTRPDIQNLDCCQCINRFLLGVSLVVIALFEPIASAAWYSFLPLLIVYPLVTGLTAFDPLYDLGGMGRGCAGADKMMLCSRLELSITGIVLTGSLFVLPYMVHGSFALFAIVAVFAIAASIAGDKLLLYRIPWLDVGSDTRPAERVSMSGARDSSVSRDS